MGHFFLFSLLFFEFKRMYEWKKNTISFQTQRLPNTLQKETNCIAVSHLANLNCRSNFVFEWTWNELSRFLQMRRVLVVSGRKTHFNFSFAAATICPTSFFSSFLFPSFSSKLKPTSAKLKQPTNKRQTKLTKLVKLEPLFRFAPKINVCAQRSCNLCAPTSSS